MLIRNRVFMNWRYSRMPVRKYNIYLAKAENYIVGYIISRLVTLEGIKSNFIVDFLFESSTLGWTAGHFLVKRVIEEFNNEMIDVIFSLLLPHTEEYRILKDHGFIVCPKIFKPYPFHLVSQIHDKNLQKKLLDDNSYWYWSLGDYDVI